MAENSPGMDPRELDALCEQFPELSRALVALALEAYWPAKDDVEAALRGLVASQRAKTPDAGTGNLDFTAQ